MKTNKLYSYLMTHDSGFAPNPFFGFLTLATCMADIRRTKNVGDWIAGFAGKALVRKSRERGISINHQGLIYLMRIGEIIPLDAYFDDPRFQEKKSIALGTNDTVRERGDNIYCSDGDGGFRQIENDNHDQGEMAKDIGGKNVLVADAYYYFGRSCPVPPASWRSLNVRVPDRYIAHGCQSDQAAVQNALQFLRSSGFDAGLHGVPCIWEAE